MIRLVHTSMHTLTMSIFSPQADHRLPQSWNVKCRFQFLDLRHMTM